MLSLTVSRDPIKPPRGWLFWAGYGVLCAPAAVSLAALAVELVSPKVRLSDVCRVAR